MIWTVIITAAVLLTLGGLCWILYQPRLQRSDGYQATVVPLANIMDVGFLAMTPLIVVLTGVDSPVFMIELVLLGLLMGIVMRYNIEYFEPLLGTEDPLTKLSGISRSMLILASLVNIAYYLQLMATLVLAPFGVASETILTALAVVLLVAIGLFGFFVGLEKLDRIGQKTTAFNIAAVIAVLAGFLLYNLHQAVIGNWHLPEYNPPEGVENQRKLLSFFAIVQGFEASRYMRDRYGKALRISTMRTAQIVSGVVFVILIASSLILFVHARPKMDAAAVIVIGRLTTPIMPLLILVAALGSQLSASVNAVSSRSDLLMEMTHNKLARRYTFPLLVIPCIVVSLLTDVTEAISWASRVFAAYYAIQCVMGIVLAFRRRKILRGVFFGAVGFAMVIIALFAIPA